MDISSTFIGIISHDKNLQEKLRLNGPENKYITYSTIDALKKSNYSILLLDFSLFSSADSIQFHLSKLRKKVPGVPAILLISEHSLPLIAHDWFIDDFLVMPARDNELSLRIKRLLTRKEVQKNTFILGRLSVNFDEYSIYLDGEKIDMTYKEFELMKLFIQNRNVIFSRKELLNKIWGIEYIGGTRTVDVHIRRLRAKLGGEFNSLIETVRNVGYKCKYSPVNNKE